MHHPFKSTARPHAGTCRHVRHGKSARATHLAERPQGHAQVPRPKAVQVGQQLAAQGDHHLLGQLVQGTCAQLLARCRLGLPPCGSWGGWRACSRRRGGRSWTALGPGNGGGRHSCIGRTSPVRRLWLPFVLAQLVLILLEHPGQRAQCCTHMYVVELALLLL